MPVSYAVRRSVYSPIGELSITRPRASIQPLTSVEPCGSSRHPRTVSACALTHMPLASSSFAESETTNNDSAPTVSDTSSGVPVVGS